MLVDPIIKIVSLIVCVSFIKSNQFVCLILYANVKCAAGRIRKSGNAFQPTDYIFPVQLTLTFQLVTFQADPRDQFFQIHVLTS